MNEIARQRQRDLYKPIRVHFIGEDGVDGGGIKKEFFQLLVTEMLSPDYGMLIFLPVRTPHLWYPYQTGLGSPDLTTCLSSALSRRVLPPHVEDHEVDPHSISGMVGSATLPLDCGIEIVVALL